MEEGSAAAKEGARPAQGGGKRGSAAAVTAGEHLHGET